MKTALLSILLTLAAAAQAQTSNQVQVVKAFDRMAIDCSADNVGEYVIKVKKVSSTIQDQINKSDVTLQLYTCVKTGESFALQAISPATNVVRLWMDRSEKLIHIERHLENIVVAASSDDYSFIQEAKATNNSDNTFSGSFSLPQSLKTAFIFVKAKVVYKVQETQETGFDFVHFGSYKITY